LARETSTEEVMGGVFQYKGIRLEAKGVSRLAAARLGPGGQERKEKPLFAGKSGNRVAELVGDLKKLTKEKPDLGGNQKSSSDTQGGDSFREKRDGCRV